MTWHPPNTSHLCRHPKQAGILESRRLDILEIEKHLEHLINAVTSIINGCKYSLVSYLQRDRSQRPGKKPAGILDTRRLDIFEIKKHLEQLIDAILHINGSNIQLLHLY